MRNAEFYSRESMAVVDGFFILFESFWVVVGGGLGGKRIIRGEFLIIWRLVVCIILLDEIVF